MVRVIAFFVGLGFLLWYCSFLIVLRSQGFIQFIQDRLLGHTKLFATFLHISQPCQIVGDQRNRGYKFLDNRNPFQRVISRFAQQQVDLEADKIGGTFGDELQQIVLAVFACVW